MTGGANTHRPLFAERDLAAPLAWRAGRPISGQAFLAAAAQLATRLPAPGRPINLCQDRLHFSLGLAAALLRGQTSLMPPNALPATLRQLPAGAGAPYVLADASDGADFTGLARVPVDFDELRATPSPAMAERSDVPRIAADLAAVCLLTSGSTGAPQPHAKRWGPLAANIAAEAARLAEWLQRPSLHGLNIVATVPAQHSYGLESSVLLALLGGASFDAGRPFYPADIAAALAQLPRPRALVTTPFHLKALLLSGVALPTVDLVLSATASLSPQLAARAEAAMGGCLGEIYGCTEAGQVAARRTTAGDLWTTLGELRIRREIEVRDAGDADAEPGERFVVSGGHVTEPTALADLLLLHDERRFRLLGRANDLIHVAGKRSSLAHLNFHLNRIEGVDDGAFWLPEPGDLAAAAPASSSAQADGDTESVVRPIAFVVAPTLSAAAVIAALRAELEPAFVPRRVVHVDALPREATGKLTVASLRTWALARFAAQRSAAKPAAHGGIDEAFTIAADHPTFAGHFPGHPLLPGVVLLSLVLRALGRHPVLHARLSGSPVIEQVKFLSPVGPGQRVQVRLREAGSGVAFECLAGERVAARGQLGAGRAR